MKNALTVLTLALCLIGCSSTPAAVAYYRINPEPPRQASSAAPADAASVVLERVELPTFLSQPGLVMQSGDNTLVISKTHLWAERLDKALPRLLTTRLQAQSDGFRFYRGHSDWASGPDYSLRVRIDNLQATAGGEVYTSGSFQILDATSGQPTILHDFRFTRDMRQDGYGEAVALMDHLVSDIAREILGVLNAI